MRPGAGCGRRDDARGGETRGETGRARATLGRHAPDSRRARRVGLAEAPPHLVQRARDLPSPTHALLALEPDRGPWCAGPFETDKDAHFLDVRVAPRRCCCRPTACRQASRSQGGDRRLRPAVCREAGGAGEARSRQDRHASRRPRGRATGGAQAGEESAVQRGRDVAVRRHGEDDGREKGWRARAGRRPTTPRGERGLSRRGRRRQAGSPSQRRRRRRAEAAACTCAVLAGAPSRAQRGLPRIARTNERPAMIYSLTP